MIWARMPLKSTHIFPLRWFKRRSTQNELRYDTHLKILGSNNLQSQNNWNLHRMELHLSQWHCCKVQVFSPHVAHDKEAIQVLLLWSIPKPNSLCSGPNIEENSFKVNIDNKQKNWIKSILPKSKLAKNYLKFEIDKLVYLSIPDRYCTENSKIRKMPGIPRFFSVKRLGLL